jgi:uncharacterized membrane protein YfcA
MNEYILELIMGLICGIFLGITGIPAVGLILLVLDYLKIGDYTSNLGSILFLNLFPITIGSIFEFYRANKINYNLGFILLFSIIIGSFIGSKMVVGEKNKLSIKMIKYLTSLTGFIIFVSFFISAQYENK